METNLYKMKKTTFSFIIVGVISLCSFVFMNSQKTDSYYFKGKIGGKEISLQDKVNEYSYNYNVAGNYHGASIQCNKYGATNVSSMFLFINYAPNNEKDFVAFFKKGIDTLGTRFSLKYSPNENSNLYKVLYEDKALIEFTEVKDLGLVPTEYNRNQKVRTIIVKGIIKKATFKECDSKYSDTFMKSDGDTLKVENLKFYQKFTFTM